MNEPILPGSGADPQEGQPLASQGEVDPNLVRLIRRSLAGEHTLLRGAEEVKVATLEKAFPGYTWRYARFNATRKHALRDTGGNIGAARLAPCGNGVIWYAGHGWMGTGNQTEYETNDALIPCKRCLTWLKKAGVGVPNTSLK